ncbi:hypothetical protein ECG_09449 [Echinococcus granulosus]|nr:hypothetical protein ECG_09449 [Echinococcus granulosus]
MCSSSRLLALTFAFLGIGALSVTGVNGVTPRVNTVKGNATTTRQAATADKATTPVAPTMGSEKGMVTPGQSGSGAFGDDDDDVDVSVSGEKRDVNQHDNGHDDDKNDSGVESDDKNNREDEKDNEKSNDTDGIKDDAEKGNDGEDDGDKEKDSDDREAKSI